MSPVVFRAGAARFELHATRRALTRDGVPVPLGARALDLLLALSARPGQLLRRSELLDTVWPDDAVEENNLAVQVNALRKAIGRELVVTIPGRGYVFAAPLAAAAAAPVDAVAAPTLFGRAADLQLLVDMLGRHRLITLIGAGGAGKTRLAQAALHTLRPAPAHGVGFVDLTQLQDAGALPGAVAAALGLGLRGADALEALVLALAPLQLVLVLDNAEHLVGGVAAAVAAMLAGAPQLACLVTSQAPLQLAEEQLLRLDGLDLPSPQATPDAALGSGAVAMFVARVQALDRRFVLDTGNVADVVAVCRSLEGLPLALELAAARLPLLGAAALRAALEQRLQLLTQGWRGAPPRQQSLRAALAWSHGLLGVAEQTVFRRMAVFAGSGSLAMLQQVLADAPGAGVDGLDGWQVLEALDLLVRRSLLRVLPEEPGAEPRYALLESPLALAREQLAASGEAAPLAQRHAAAVAGLFAEAEDRLWRGDARVATRPVDELLAADIGNGSAALAWALQHDVALALRIGVTLSRVLGANRYRERIALCRRIEPLLDAALSPTVPAAVLGFAALQCAEALHQTAAVSAARARQARAWLAEAGVPRGCYVALCVEARAQARLGAMDLLPQLMAELDMLEEPGGPPAVMLMGAAVRSHWAALQHDRDGERRWMYRCAALLRDAGRSDTAPMVNLVGIERRAGRHAEAIALGAQIVQRLQGTRQQLELTHTWVNLCTAQIAAGQLDAARQSARAAWPLVRQFDLHPNWADNAALLAVHEGRAADALKLLGYAEHAYAQLGTQREGLGQADLARAEQAAIGLLVAAGATQTPAGLKAEGQALADAALAQLG